MEQPNFKNLQIPQGTRDSIKLSNGESDLAGALGIVGEDELVDLISLMRVVLTKQDGEWWKNIREDYSLSLFVSISDSMH